MVKKNRFLTAIRKAVQNKMRWPYHKAGKGVCQMDWLKKGDKVRMKCNHAPLSAGDIVTIEKVDKSDERRPYFIGGCWPFSDEFEPVSKFSVGQVYRVGNVDDREDNIIKVTDISADRFKYATIRGKDSLHYAGKDSCFADVLELLTGKEIGEAIRKWDADHAKKPETKYNEVKRRAKPREYIKLVSASFSFDRKGDILRMGEDGYHILGKDHPRKTGFDNEPWCYTPEEYVVLEGYKPEQTGEHRKAKVGDTIRILPNAFCLGNGCKPGDTVYIDGKKNRPSVDGFIWGCGASLDEYVIISSGKHSYTTEQIAEAKKLCGEMMTELLESGEIRIRFQDKDNDPPYYDGRTYVYAEKPGYIPTEAYASCSGHDEYNVWIGRCVALCKALHKPIPTFITGDGNGRHFDFEKARSKGSSAVMGGSVTIHCKTESECKELFKEMDKLGYKWCSEESLIDHENYFHGSNGFYNFHDDRFVGFGHVDSSNYVEFSDCFTED